jgi:hypothetical protein
MRRNIHALGVPSILDHSVLVGTLGTYLQVRTKWPKAGLQTREVTRGGADGKKKQQCPALWSEHRALQESEDQNWSVTHPSDAGDTFSINFRRVPLVAL